MQDRQTGFLLGIGFCFFVLLVYLSGLLTANLMSGRSQTIREITHNNTIEKAVPVVISISREIDPNGNIEINGVPMNAENEKYGSMEKFE